MIALTVYNNLTRKKELFSPLVPGEVKFYSCGPTTYDFLHVGNARALVVGDLFNRILRSLGYKVTFVRNFTDVDDKIIARAAEENRDALLHADIFVKECEKDMESLGMMRPDHSPKVSETMPEIIGMIETLIKKGTAYEVAGEVLYHVPLFKEYGKLSRMDLDSLQHGKRVQVEDHKKHPADFVLWKPAKPGEPSWDSPWGKGRPGWHIECSAMALKHLGETIDLHHGGVDLIFPHHENEIAQSEMANGCPFCLHWCHNEFLNFGSEKMSKSLGNVVTIRKFAETYGGMILRQIFLSTHYRAKVDYSEEVIEKAMNDVERIHQFVLEIERASKTPVPAGETNGQAEGIREIRLVQERMREELANDFNVPGAMGHFFTFIRTVRREYLGENLQGEGSMVKSLPETIYREIQGLLDFARRTLGLIHNRPEEVLEKINESRGMVGKGKGDAAFTKMDKVQIEKMILDRKQLKDAREWKKADEIRNNLKENRVILQDHPDGSTTWKYE